jgi:YidC/Oxa1 family membrane protein insertase
MILRVFPVLLSIYSNFKQCFRAAALMRFVVWAALVLLAFSPIAARAQFAGSMNVTSTLPPPPAWVIAQRMANAGDWVGALKKLSDIPASASYRGTNYVPEAIYSIAHIDEDHLGDDNSAINQLNTLFNNYQTPQYVYPHKSVIAAEREALGKKIDAENRADALSLPTDWGSIPSIWAAIMRTGYLVIDYAVRLTGSKKWSYPLALFLIALVMRLAMWPLTIKQYKSMKEMQRIAPMVKELKAKYANDSQTFATKQMELYKEHNVNPAAGCAPMLMQLPVFYYMYHAVWLYQYQFSHGNFLWINPTFHKLLPMVFGANLSDQDLLLLFLYSVSMYVTQRMMPVADPTMADQMKTQALMSAGLFFFIFQNYHFPSAFVLYWLFSNVVSSSVQLYSMRSGNYMMPATAKIGPEPADGDPDLLGSNGNGGNGAFGNGTVVRGTVVEPSNGRIGTAKGIIGPKVHPKKKKR